MNGNKSCTSVNVTVVGKAKSKPEVCGVVTPSPVDALDQRPTEKEPKKE